MTVLTTSALIFIVTLAIGSFLNVCIYRLAKDESIISPGSRCPECGKPLQALDLIPVLSYILLRGRCRYCKARISPRYALVELLTALLFVLVYLKEGLSASSISHMSMTGFLIVVSFIDLDTMEVPDSVVFTGMAVGFIFAILQRQFLGSLIGAAFGFSFMYVLAIAAKWIMKRDAMGEGDATLSMMVGSFLGASGALASIFAAFIVGGAIAVFLLIFGLRKFGEEVPFGPMLGIGALIVIFFGRAIAGSYLNLI